MAEAYSLVAVSFEITPDGHDLKFNFNAVGQIIRSIVRSWKRRYGRLKNRLVNNVYPLSYKSLLVSIGISAFIFFSKFPKLHSLQNKIAKIPKKFVWMGDSMVLTICLNGLILWILNILFFKYGLRALLKYQGWIFDERKNITWRTKIWMAALRCFGGEKSFRSYQSSLPRLPLPRLEKTIQRYLKSAECIYQDDQMEELRTQASNFLDSQGPKLQRYLRLKSWWASNYVSDWWEEYIYLVDRSPICMNSNYYTLGIAGHAKNSSTRQASRAAGVVSSLLSFRRNMNTENIKPVMVYDSVPLCTWQYDRMFNTSRIAHTIKGRRRILCLDKLEHFDVSNHITVSWQGKYYKVYIYCDSQLASPSELERVFDYILSDPSCPADGEEFLGVVTAVDRDTAASLRTNYFSDGINKDSIQSLDRAAFHLILDDIPAKLEITSDSDHLSNLSKHLFLGKGYDRWFEKSFNLIVFSDGHVGTIAEHTWGDALVLSHMFEMATLYEMKNIEYMEDGRIVRSAFCKCRLIDPIRLKFDFDDNLVKLLSDHSTNMTKHVDNLDLRVFQFDGFGKAFGRVNNLSTDSLIQLALQLAYYRETGVFVHTYESASTRFFLEGRTETIRSCTVESCRFVRAKVDDHYSNETLRELAMEALTCHLQISRMATIGMGIDRHLFALFIVSKFMDQKSPFLERVLQESWGISSSQTPLTQSLNPLFMNLAKCSPGGGFGPTCFRGYGVAYFPNENMISFHVSCLKNAECRDAKIFGHRIEDALREIAEVIQRDH